MKNLFLLALASCLILFSCSKDEDTDDTPVATCTDGIQNQGETGIDCGGPCAACNVCVTCVSSVQGSNDITYCESDFQSQADYDAAVNSAVLSGRTCQ